MSTGSRGHHRVAVRDTKALEQGPSQNLKTHLLKMSQCPNCGGKLEWDPEKTTDVVQSSCCGVSTKIKLL